ncbi:Phage tail collar domain-containing protein [Plasmodiophora brassicae]
MAGKRIVLVCAGLLAGVLLTSAQDTPYLGAIALTSFSFPPKGWAFCNGQILPINQNQALFALLGTTYGGNGQTTFALPDLRGRSPVHVSGSTVLGQKGGAETVTITTSTMPAHTHAVPASSSAANGNTAPLASSVFGATNVERLYCSTDAAPSTTLDASAVGSAGGSQPHENMPPYLALNYVIALQGIFPSQN